MGRRESGRGGLAFILVSVAGLTVMAGCSGGAPATRPVTDPSTVAQVKARLLVPGTAPGFYTPAGDAMAQKTTAGAFNPPRGNTRQLCQDLTIPQASFRLFGALSGTQEMSLTDQKGYEHEPPGWIESIDVYPGMEASDIVAALPGLIGRCKYFLFSNPGAGPKQIPVREGVTRLRGLGEQALYVGVWLPYEVNEKVIAADWVVIRSGRTLIWLEGSNLRDLAVGKQNAQTLQLAKDAWDRFSAAPP
jgi:hypothetical protein